MLFWNSRFLIFEELRFRANWTLCFTFTILSVTVHVKSLFRKKERYTWINEILTKVKNELKQSKII